MHLGRQENILVDQSNRAEDTNTNNSWGNESTESYQHWHDLTILNLFSKLPNLLNASYALNSKCPCQIANGFQNQKMSTTLKFG